MNKTMKIVTILTIAMAAFALAGTVAALDDWQQFQKNETKYAVSSADAIAGAGPTVTWNTPDNGNPGCTGSFGSAPIAHGGYVYASNGGGLHKYTYDGTKQTNWPPAGGGGFYGSPAYGNGTERIFYYGPLETAPNPDRQSIKGVDENDPTDIWTVYPSGASGDAWGIFKSEITYAVNKTGTKSIYFGDFGDRFYCYDVGGANFALRWTYVGAGQQFWAGASVIGDYVVFGNQSGWVTCLQESDGSFVDAIHINKGNIKSSMCWSNGHIFFTNYGGHLSKVGFNTANGQFDDVNATSVVIPSTPTTTPVVHNGRVYVSYDCGVRCLHESNLTQIWDHSITSLYRLQASPALAMRDGHVYVYVTMNDGTGGVICINDTGPSGVQEWRNNAVGGYSMQGVAIAENATGTWIFATSQGSGKLAGHWQKDPPPRKPDLNVTAIETSAMYAGTYNIVKATIKNVGNASAGEFDVTLAAGTTVVDTESVGTLGAGESTVVKFVWTPTATGTPTLNVTADSGYVVSEWDETNNSMTKGVTVGSIPATDLAVIEVNSCDLANGEDNTVFAVIENRGADASGFDVTLLNGTEVVDTVFVPMLHFRDSQLVAFNWTPTTAGTANLNVTIEDGGYKTQNVNVVTPVIVSESVSIQSAVNSAGANNLTIINVESGTYNETVTLPMGKLIRLVANASDVVICNDTGDIITIEGTCCYVDGFTINGSGFNASGMWPNYGGSCINITSEWNVVRNNHIYNRSGGIKLYGEKNLIRCNTVGESANDRVCLCQMAISGDCNAIVKNTFDGNTAAHATYSWILGGTFTNAGVTKDVNAFNNTVRGNNFTMTGGAGWASGDILFGGDPNMIFNNIINDTGSNVVELGELNWYNVTKVAVEDPAMGNVVHGPYYGGNYWLNYTGSDSDQDLLGDADVPYLGVDRHPLVRALCGDVNCDGELTSQDISKLKQKIVHGEALGCEWAGDVNCDGELTSQDISKLKQKIVHGEALDCYENGCP